MAKSQVLDMSEIAICNLHVSARNKKAISEHAQEPRRVVLDIASKVDNNGVDNDCYGGNMSALENYIQKSLPFAGYEAEAEIEEPVSALDIMPNQKPELEHVLKMTYNKEGAQLSLSLLESDRTLDEAELRYFGEKHLGERTLKVYSFPQEFGNTGNDVLDDFASSKNLYLVFTANRNAVDNDDPLDECLSRADIKGVYLREAVLGHSRLSLKMFSAMLEREKDRNRRIMLGESLRKLYLLITKIKENSENSYQIPTSLRKTARTAERQSQYVSCPLFVYKKDD